MEKPYLKKEEIEIQNLITVSLAIKGKFVDLKRMITWMWPVSSSHKGSEVLVLSNARQNVLKSQLADARQGTFYAMKNWGSFWFWHLKESY